MDASVASLNNYALTFVIIGIISIIITGIILGFKSKIVVFRDYNDLGLAFIMTLVPVVILYLLAILSALNKVSIAAVLIFESGLLLWLALRTYEDNQHLLFFSIAMVTKLTLSLLFIINLIEFVAPGGRDRRSKRGSAFAILLLISPFIFALVRNKEGIFNPEKTLSRRGISF